MSAAVLEDMMLERAAGKNPWDRRSSGKAVGDVNETTLRAFVERAVGCDRIPFGYTDARDVLARLGLLCEDGTLTNAAAVCFTRSRDVALRMGVFADNERIDILDNHQERGDLFELVDAAELYILNNTRRAFIIDDSSLHRGERPEIPKRAIREALFNAFCHRRYEDDAAIQVDVFWDAVDICSPGPFPSVYTPDDYLAHRATASKPRNRLIAQTLYKSGDIEAFGTGLLRIKRACDEQGVPVEVSQRGGFVHVRFTRSEAVAAIDSATESPNGARMVRGKYANGLSRSESTVLGFVTERGEVGNAEVAEHMGMSLSGSRKALQRLMDRGLVVREGQGKRTRYLPSARS